MTKEEQFLEITKDLVGKIFPEHPHSTFLFKGNKCFFEQERERNYLWCNSQNVWSIFQDKFGMKYSEVQEFLKIQIELKYKWSDLTPYSVNKIYSC